MFANLLKYGLVTIFGYIFLFLSTLFFVEILRCSKIFSYFISITIIYISTYFIYTKFVFDTQSNKKRILKFCIYLIIFWFINNIFFNLLIEYLNIHYLLAIICNIVFLGLIRFLVLRTWIFK
ncbi:GtrA family protein [Candidatus Parcubacteria bacterium]|nr:GtrA family protein [Candidatus Parcubacteria bacterium]